MLELYHSGLTTCSKQVRHCLREKGLKYESKYVELWRYENLSPDYLKLNPNGVVPTLVHDGTPIINSFCINEYIEDAFPEPPLRPAGRDGARADALLGMDRGRDPSAARAADPCADAACAGEDLSAQDHEIMLQEHAGAGEARPLARADEGRLFRRAARDRARQRAVRVRADGEGDVRARPWLAGADVLARRHQHARRSCIASSSFIRTGSSARRFHASTTGGTARCSGPRRSMPIPTAPTRRRRGPATKSIAGIAEYRV